MVVFVVDVLLLNFIAEIMCFQIGNAKNYFYRTGRGIE